MTEAEFQNTIIEYAHLRGWLVAHFRGVRVQRRNGTVHYQTPVAADGKGFPDLVLVRERVVWAEIKVGYNKMTKEQETWADALKKAGQEFHLWKPEDFDDIVIVLGPQD